MTKPLLALGLMTAGASALAAVGYLQTHRYALTQIDAPPEPAPAAQESRAAPAVVEEPVIVEGPSELVLYKKPRHLARRPAVQAPLQLVPCTEWREIGPVATRAAGEPSQRRVQMLCPAGTLPPAADR